MASARAIIAAALGCAISQVAAAQSPADRPLLDSLLQQFSHDTAPSQLPTNQLCLARSTALGALCDGLITTRLAELSGKRRDAERARGTVLGVLSQHPDWPVAWYALAAARLAADETGAGPDHGLLEEDHADNAAGAERALIRSLGFDPTFVPAAEALVLAPVVHDSTASLFERVAMLRKVRRLLPPQYLFAMALVEREDHHLDSAVALEIALLRNHAVPRGLVDITLAGDLFASGNHTPAEPVYFAGADDSAQVSRDAYRRNLLLVASAAELATWDSLAPTGRPQWLRRFWAVRDVRDGRPAGSRLVEHFQRIEEVFAMYRYRYVRARHEPVLPLSGAIAYFTTAVPGVVQPFSSFGSYDDVLDDRGLVYIRQGVPYLSMRTGWDSGFELWQYKRAGEQLYLSFSPKFINGAARVGPWPVALLRHLADRTDWDQPAVVVPTVAASTPDDYGYRHQDFCALKHSLCAAVVDSTTFTSPKINCTAAVERPGIQWQLGDPRFANRPEGRLPMSIPALIRTRDSSPPLDAPYIYEREREEGFWSIDQASTTDAFPVPFSRQVTAAFEAHALRHADGSTRLVVAIAIPGKELPPAQIDFAQAVVVFPLHVHVAALNAETGERFDVDTITTAFAPPATNKDPLVGSLELPLPAGHYSTSIWVMQLADSSGVLVQLDSIVVPKTVTTFGVSDLVIGSAKSATQWNSGTDMVPLNPLGTYAEGGSAEAYFQLAGMVKGQTYQTRFEFFRDGDKLAARPSLAISSAYVAAADGAAIERTLGLQALERGSYRVRVTVSGATEQAAATGCLTIVK